MPHKVLGGTETYCQLVMNDVDKTLYITVRGLIIQKMEASPERENANLAIR